LIERGKEPISDELIEAMNAAAKETAEDLRRNQAVIVSETQRFMADLVAGQLVDLEARVQALIEKIDAS
jgi:hypothetical protein